MNPDARPLIDDFWAGTATLAERQRLLALLGPDDAEAATWLLLPDDDADAAGLAGPPPAPLSPEQAARVLRRLRWRLALDAAPASASPSAVPAAPRPRLRAQAGRAPRWVALTVLVFALVAGASWLLTRRPAPTPPLAQHTAPPPVDLLPTAPPAAPVVPALVRRTNSGPAPRRLTLPDGSVVTLEAGSTLAYRPFGPTSRELSLRGAALFAVAKDVARPFTVEAGGFRTTALGTRFRVESRAGGRVKVRLLTGKVVVRTAAASPFAMQDQYLTPGRELRADAHTQEVRVGTFDSVATAPRGGAGRAAPPTTAALPLARPDNQGHLTPAAPALTVWVCTWCRHTYTSPKQPTSFEPDKCPRNPGKAHAWHKKYPGLDAN